MTTRIESQDGTGAATFGQRLRAATQQFGPLCAGIDPHRALVESWGLTYDLDGLRAFTRACVDAFGGHVGVVKPQSAFFEVFGSAGVAVLEGAVTALRESGTVVILDAKRGDIGTTMDAYAEAFLGKDAIDSPDAMTVSPYLGYGSLRPAIDLADQTGRGVFVLALTSNPEGAQVQHAVLEGRSVAGSIVDGARADNAAAFARGELGHVGLVVGATVGNAVQDLGLDLTAMGGPILAPGVGAQGGTSDDLKRVFGDALPNVLPASSREVLSAGPDVSALRARAAQSNESLAALLS
ncbi:orotidine 5'-phosphate decarboxylase [Janibacter sp. HTCC2649]|uniref:orotidine-5'-phosphate decarboxylase n=1 Tax=Janibacter sp. HTCC2649 TaxID=313589 RepID=UPI000066EC6B|nr:orotidine-5'-phosphate decarboxylase [Janibacter sp. HTCC2649]EAP99302.1 orotidine 5'-phosphate decarboxylase [Janibacter sp. HTCC2649]